MACPVLWTVAAAATCTRSADDTLEKMCVKSPSQCSALSFEVAFTVRHTIKLAHLKVVEEAHCFDDFRCLFQIAASTAKSATLKHFPSFAAKRSHINSAVDH